MTTTLMERGATATKHNVDLEALDQDGFLVVHDHLDAMVATRQGKDVTEWYRQRYRGVVAAEKRGGEVLMLFDEGDFYGVNRQILAFPDTDREVLVRAWADHVPKSRIDLTRPLFGQWAG